ncbi:unnamed protein product [Parnassius apollo]|uniref:(apollo) hypothetical protein n=1 Tax=Parnassius apollo TaxID=110799 RepID=A0A8S3W387_PARAO|nr:unnamed protein product [Parnassius apollo]
MKIVRILNDLYTAFDVLTDAKKNPNVYKVETVGDKYMAKTVTVDNEPVEKWLLVLLATACDAIVFSVTQ